MAFIYGLVDPLVNEVRYVGYTNTLATRLQQHLSEAREYQSLLRMWRSTLGPTYEPPRRPGTGIKISWIQSVLDAGRQPAMLVLMECRPEDKAFYEAFWVAIYGMDNLLNSPTQVGYNRKPKN